jgi:putative FmdB family regulatory protein
MPLYEYHCLGCTLTFESLVPLSAARRSRTCPRCGRRSPRVTSAFAIAGRRGPSEQPLHGAAAPAPKPERPLCMRYPEVPLLCHMDQKSAERFVAHVQGRGAQYDDTVAARVELRKKRGEPPPEKPAAPGHVHAHDHSHGGKQAHAHSHRHARHH